MAKLSWHKVIISALIALWVVVTVVILDIFHIAIYWPTFTVLNLLTIIGFTKHNIAKIFLSCIAGIGISLLFIHTSTFLTPLLGAMASNLLMLFLVIFAILALDEVLPICLNTHTVIVFAYCMVNAHEFAIIWPHTLISTVLGGGIALAGIMVIIKISPKLARKNTVPKSRENPM